MKIEQIIILANKYPNQIEKNVNVFTQQLTWCFADMGISCKVICPKPIGYEKMKARLKSFQIEKSENGKIIEIYRPTYLSFGQSNSLFQKQRVSITTNNYISAVDRVLSKFNLKNTVLFAEFICPSSVAASQLGIKYKIPAFMQCGEATYQGDKKYGNEHLSKLLSGLTGAVALSGQNKGFLVDNGLISSDKVLVLPSGYRRDRFFSRNKIIARKKMGLPIDKFIVGFCGSYDERKGVKRLEKAIEQTKDIYFACVGKGPREFCPISKKCLMSKVVNHDELSWFYNSLDIFVMPTYNEGSCTAIVEAIACGLPIISSDRSFNYEICDSTNSLLIEPDDIEALKKSLLLLYNDDELRRKLSHGSYEKSKYLSLDDKVKKMIAFIEYRLSLKKG